MRIQGRFRALKDRVAKLFCRLIPRRKRTWAWLMFVVCLVKAAELPDGPGRWAELVAAVLYLLE